MDLFVLVREEVHIPTINPEHIRFLPFDVIGEDHLVVTVFLSAESLESVRVERSWGVGVTGGESVGGRVGAVESTFVFMLKERKEKN